MLYLSNSFSVTMLQSYPDYNASWNVRIRRISAYAAGNLLKYNPFISCYGHAETAAHLSRYLHIRVEPRRDPIELRPEDILIIAHVHKGRAYREGFRKCPKWTFYEVTRD